MNAHNCDVEALKRIFEKGLCGGLSDKKGRVCIEVAIALASGEAELSDRPTCVAAEDRRWAIHINDENWSSPRARSEAMLPIALAQLGTEGTDRDGWVKALIEGTIRRVLPMSLRAVAWQLGCDDLSRAADRCEFDGDAAAARAAARAAAAEVASDAGDAASDAARAAARAAAAEVASDADDAARAAARAAAYAASTAARAYGEEVRDAVLCEAVAVALAAYEVQTDTISDSSATVPE